MRKKDNFEKKYKRALKEYGKGELCWGDVPVDSPFLCWSDAPDVFIPKRVWDKVLSKDETFIIDPETDIWCDNFTIRIYRRKPLEIAVPIKDKKNGIEKFDVYDPLYEELNNPPQEYAWHGRNITTGAHEFERLGYQRQMVKSLSFGQYYYQPIVTFYQLNKCSKEDWDNLKKAWNNSKNHTGDWQPFYATMKDVRGRCCINEADEFEKRLGEKLPEIELYNADDFIFYAYPSKFFAHEYGICEHYEYLADNHGHIRTFFRHPLLWLKTWHTAIGGFPVFGTEVVSSYSTIYCVEKMLHNMKYRKEAYAMGFTNYHLDSVYAKNQILSGPIMRTLKRRCGLDLFILRMKARWLGWITFEFVGVVIFAIWLFHKYWDLFMIGH